MGGKILAASLLLLCLLVPALAGYDNHVYKLHEKVPVHANKIGPFANPTETYPFYYLDFCKPPEIVEEDAHLGEVLKGDRKTNSAYDVRFKVDIEWQSLCSITLTQDNREKFIEAIENEYFLEMFLDDLPMWEYVGVSQPSAMDETKQHQLFTHMHFSISYNDDQIIAVNMSANPSEVLNLEQATEGQRIEFSFSVQWKPTKVPFLLRVDQASPFALFTPSVSPSHEIHWLSIVNSFFLVFLLTAFLAVILLRVLKNDVAKYMNEDLEGSGEETGWKLLHGDVFRHPKYASIFCAIIGNGAQLLVLIFSLLFFILVGIIYPGYRGALYSCSVVTYCLTACVAGFVSNFLYKQLDGTNWVRCTVLTSLLLTVPIFLVFSIVNTVAIAYQSTIALPFLTIFKLAFLWLLVGFPLTVAGSIIGKRTPYKYIPPSRTNKLPREVPEPLWYQQRHVQFAIAGLLPFSSIYIELHYIFQSVWGHAIYSLYGFLLLVFILLIVVSSCVTIAIVYFQLSREDHRWWWLSLLSGGSTGVFIFVYSIIFFQNSSMFGLLQTTYFFLYMFLVSYAFFLILACVGFTASAVFVHYIYRSIKLD